MSTAILERPRISYWRSVMDAIRGIEHDYTDGSISRAIFLLATPMVLEMVMESLFAIVNVFWVTRLGANAVATVGLTESMMTLVFAVAMGVSLSTTAMVARRIGEKRREAAAVAAVQSILLGVTVAVLMGIPGYLLAPRLLAWMGAPHDLVAMGHRYTAIVLGGSVTVMLLFLNNAIFRGAGDAAIAMRVLWTANIINMALDPLFIFGLNMGVTGAAYATVIGRGCGVLFQMWLLFHGRGRIRLSAGNMVVNWPVMKTLIRVSATGVMQFAIAHTSWIVLVRFISAFGSVAVAGYTIGIRMFIFVILPCWGFSGAAATMVGQNLGAHKPERAERAVWITAGYNVVYLGLVAVLFLSVPEFLVGLFTREPAVMKYAVDCLRIVALGNLAYALGMVLIQAFNGAGDTITPTWINVIGFWLVEIPLAWALAFHAGLEVRGVYISIPAAEALISALGLYLFWRGAWKTRKI